MRAALSVARDDDLFLLGGDVPYVAGGPTLGLLMRDWLTAHKVPPQKIQLLKKVYGTFSEARSACETAKDLGIEKLIVISSPWYFFAGMPIWKRRAKENHRVISFITTPHTGGLSTWLIYSLIGIVVRTAILIGAEKCLEIFFTRTQKKRAAGFTFNGCA